MIATIPRPSELLEMVAKAKAEGRNHIRFLVPPKRKYLERFVRLWDGVTGRAVGREMEQIELPTGEAAMVLAALVVEMHVTSVLEAARREARREADLYARPLAVNQIQLNKPIIRAR